jgi:hypothetical protein
MRAAIALLAVGVLLVLGGCAQEKEWMKVGTDYSTEEFRRDHSACSRGGRLDEECMRSRGWITVTPPPPPKQGPVTPEQVIRRPGVRY